MDCCISFTQENHVFNMTVTDFAHRVRRNADAHKFLLTAENELSMRSSSLNVTDSNKPILHLINCDPSLDICRPTWQNCTYARDIGHTQQT